MSSDFSAHYFAAINPDVDNTVSIIRLTSAFPIKQPLSNLSNENGSSDRPLYSLDAGFIVTNTAEKGLTLDTGIVISDKVKVSLRTEGSNANERLIIDF